MRTSTLPARLVGIALLLVTWIATAGARQAPPPEMSGFVLMNSGPVPTPTTCSCISSPFTVPVDRPGWGYGHGPAAPAGNAKPSEADRKRQAARDAEERENLPRIAQDAIAGNSAASISLGYDLTIGTAVRRNDEEAARWFHLAARQGHPDAYVQLGYRYSRGVGVPQNDATAAYWYGRAAAAGNRPGMVGLGLIYAAGRGAEQNWAAAVHWWTQAAESRFIGDAYVCGVGVERDYERAIVEYRKAAETGDASSSRQLGHMYRHGCASANDETMFEAYQKAAEVGDPEAQVALSELYFQGLGAIPNPYAAYMWGRLAERRLPPGTLQSSAQSTVAASARLLSAAEIRDVERMVENLLVVGSTPMR